MNDQCPTCLSSMFPLQELIPGKKGCTHCWGLLLAEQERTQYLTGDRHATVRLTPKRHSTITDLRTRP